MQHQLTDVVCADGTAGITFAQFIGCALNGTDTVHKRGPFSRFTDAKLLDKITWDDGVNLTAERFLCSRYAVPREMSAEIKEKRELWKEILGGRMDESSMPEGESWSYLEDTADSIKEATYRLKNMALLDYITECYKTKKGSQ